MTLFWILAATLTAIVVLTVLRPLLRRPHALPERAAFDREVYRDQLNEIEQDRRRGLLEPGQADAARAEIARRMLATTAPGSESPPPAIGHSSKRLAIGLMTALPIGSLAIYLLIGRPDLPAQPFAERATPAEHAAIPDSVLSAVNHLAERLKSNPDNLEGWALLAQSLGKLGRPSEALEAWRQAARLAPDNPDIRGNFAEALVVANRGLVSEEARQQFEAILTKNPGDPRSAHYLAEASAAAGDIKGALERWKALAAASPANAPWLPMVQQRIRDMTETMVLK
ncbi:MAG: c-type cytochrome biogenesis protein CcmI [Rhodospirillaceae bacterium]